MAATDYDTEAEAIFGRLNTNWSDATPIAWPNEGYEPDAGDAWLEPVLNTQDAFNADIASSPRIRHPGLLTVNVRTPLGEGDGQARRLGDDVADIFRNVSFSGITFRAPTVRPVGREDGWYRVQVDCPYWRDSTH